MIDLSESGLDYEVGDSLGVYAKNAPALVDQIIAAIKVPPDFPIADKPLRDVLIEDMSLSPAPDSLFTLISYLTGGERKQKARALAKGGDPDGDAETLDVLGALEKFPGIHPDPEALVESLEPLQPRLYSISSSPKAEPGRVCLTVDAVRYTQARRLREGVASTFLDGRIAPRGRAQGVRAEGARLCAAARSRNANCHGRPRHGHRAVPRLFAGAPRDKRARPLLALLRAPAPRDRFFLRGGACRAAAGRHAHAAVARLVARRRQEGLRAEQDARGSGGASCVAASAARTSMSAATRSGWRKTSRRRSSRSSPAAATSSPADAKSYVEGLKKAGRYQTDVY